jgi:hypothetical protein
MMTPAEILIEAEHMQSLLDAGNLPLLRKRLALLIHELKGK